LRHICFDPTRADPGIVNYRLDDQDKALGAYCALFACANSKPRNKFAAEIEDYLEALEATLLKGYKREVRPRIRDENPGLSLAELKQKVTAAAEKRVKKHLEALKSDLKIDA